MKVLLVAPRKSDLAAVDAEIQDISRVKGLSVTLLVGQITATQLLREIRDGDFDCLWLATHGNADYIELSGVEKVTAEELVPLVRGRFGLVVLNTCNSLRIAKMLQLQANVGVICSLISTADATAYKFGSLLSVALVEHPTIADAYLATVFGNDESYLYLAALRTNPSAIESLGAKIDGLNEKLARELVMYRYALYASLALHIPEIVTIIWLLLQQVE